MRRIGLIVSSLLAAGILFGATRAFACQDKVATNEHKRVELKSADRKSLHGIFTPAQATKQGKLDDRLIRPHRSYDASAGLVG